MGLTYVTVKIQPLLGGKKHLEESFLVDAGAVDCLVAADRLRKAGIKQSTRIGVDPVTRTLQRMSAKPLK